MVTGARRCASQPGYIRVLGPRARLCCLLVDGRVEFAAITAHQPANCSKRAASRHVRASRRYGPASCEKGKIEGGKKCERRQCHPSSIRLQLARFAVPA